MKVNEAYEKINELAQNIADTLADVFEDSFGFDDIELITKLLIEVVKCTEEILKGSGATQKEKLDFASKLLDKVIVFGGWAKIFELIDGKAIRYILSFIVDFLNAKIGEKWLDKLEDNWEYVNTALKYLLEVCEQKS